MEKKKDIGFITKFARKKGMLPDKYWAQLNGQSAQENYAEQKNKILEEIDQRKEPNDDDDVNINLTTKKV